MWCCAQSAPSLARNGARGRGCDRTRQDPSQLVLSSQRERVKARCRPHLVATSHSWEERLQAREDPRLPPTLKILFFHRLTFPRFWMLPHTLWPCNLAGQEKGQV